MNKLGKGIGGALMSLAFVFGIFAATSTSAQAQYRNDGRYQRRDDEWRRRQAQEQWRRNRNNRGYDNRGYDNRGYNNNGSYGNYGGYNQQDLNSGYQQGLNTGASDAQRGQSYSPERSHFYRDGGYSQAFRQGFVQGYNQGYRQYAGNGNGRYRNNRGNNGGLGNILGGIFRP